MIHRMLPSDGEQILLKLHDDGVLQLVNRETARSLAPGLLRLIARGVPGGEVAEWLIAQRGVAEVFADDSELATALATASAPFATAPAATTKSPATNAPLPTNAPATSWNLEEDDGAWRTECQIDLGFGEVTANITVHDERDAARIDEALRILRGSWNSLLAPELAGFAERLFADPIKTAAALESLNLDIRPAPRWGIQMTFDAPGMRTTSYFLDFEDDRVIDACAAD